MKIELIPAIDIINGQCVRLTKGDYDQKTVYGNPLDMALEFERIGYKRLHVVDLDGAKSKHIVNDAVLREITSQTNLVVDFGGGIKTDEDLEKAFAAGASMVTVGSIAVTQPELFMGWLEKYGAERMILGADVRNGKISINGWKEDSSEDLLPFLQKYIDAGVKNVVLGMESVDTAHSGARGRRNDVYSTFAGTVLDRAGTSHYASYAHFSGTRHNDIAGICASGGLAGNCFVFSVAPTDYASYRRIGLAAVEHDVNISSVCTLAYVGMVVNSLIIGSLVKTASADASHVEDIIISRIGSTRGGRSCNRNVSRIRALADVSVRRACYAADLAALICGSALVDLIVDEHNFAAVDARSGSESLESSTRDAAQV